MPTASGLAQTLNLAKNDPAVCILDLSDAVRIAMNIPEGFKPLFRTSPVLDLIGPIYYVGEGKDLVLGLRAERKHCNARGTVHGGILATLADVALGYTMAFSSEPPAALITANLTLDFAGTARIGDWLETSVDIQRQGSRLSFANAYITVASQRIVRASAVFLASGELNEQSED